MKTLRFPGTGITIPIETIKLSPSLRLVLNGKYSHDNDRFVPFFYAVEWGGLPVSVAARNGDFVAQIKGHITDAVEGRLAAQPVLILPPESLGSLSDQEDGRRKLLESAYKAERAARGASGQTNPQTGANTVVASSGRKDWRAEREARKAAKNRAPQRLEKPSTPDLDRSNPPPHEVMPAQEAFPNGDAARVSTENSIAPAASAGASGTVPQPGEAQDSALKIQRPEMLQSGEAPAPPIIAQNALTSVPAEPDPDVDPEDTLAPPVQHYRGSAEPKGDGVDALPAIVEQSAAVSPTSAEPPTIADFREAAVALVRAFQRIDVELSGRHRKLLERVDGINPQGTTTSLAQMARSGGRYVADNQRDLEEARDFLVAEASLNGRLTISRDAAIEVLRMYERPQRPMDWALNNKIIEHGGAAAAAAAINQDISVLRGAIQRVLEPMARRLQAAARDLT